MKPDGHPAVMRHEGDVIHVWLHSCGFDPNVVHCWRAFDAKGKFISNLQLKDEGVIWIRGRSRVVLEAINKLVGSAA